MIGRAWINGGEEIRFEVRSDRAVSVVGDFNGWDPEAGVLTDAGDGARSRSVALAAGRYAFRYLDADGRFFDDPDADLYEPNGHGQVHGVLVVASNDADPVAPATAPEPAIDLDAPLSPASGAATAGRRRRRGAQPPVTLLVGHSSAEDDAIRTTVLLAVTRHPYLGAVDLRCEVVDRVVHLSGVVPSRLAKQAVWEIAWADRRVADVDNRVSMTAHEVRRGIERRTRR